MSFEDLARRRAQLALEALARQHSEAARSELGALRSAIDARLAALPETLVHPEQAGVFDRLVQDLSTMAAEEAEAAGDRSRRGAEAVAADALAAARAEAQIELEAAQAEWQARCSALQTANTGLLEAAEEARQRARIAQAAAQTEIDRARVEQEAQTAQAQAVQSELSRALADAQREAIDHAVAHRETEAHLQVLKGELTRMNHAHQDGEARLEAEQRRRTELEACLDEARQAMGVARTDADASRRQLDLAMDEIRMLQQAAQSEASARAAADESRVALDAVRLERLRHAWRAIGAATDRDELMEVLLDHLGHEFAKAALFVVGQSSLTGWQSRGLGATDITNIAMALTIDSPLTRVVAERRPITIEATGMDAAMGVFGTATGSAVALPVVANGRVIVVAYGELPGEPSMGSSGVPGQIAEMLAEWVSHRLTVRPRHAPHEATDAGRDEPRGAAPDTAPSRPAYSPARQAPRTRMPDGMEVIVEGTASRLVDLSSLGAQILSSSATRPNRAVRLMLPTDDGALSCKGYVVWALFEPRGSDDARYRAGVKFTDVDSRALGAFLHRYQRNEPLSGQESRVG
jgi:hypothetical protein